MKITYGYIAHRTSTLTVLWMVVGFLGSLSSFAQVGINNYAPDSSAILDLAATQRGLLVPRMPSQRRMEIINEVGVPAEGLLVYDTDDQMFYYYNTANNDGDNGSGDRNWQALSPMLFKDSRENPTTNGSGKTVYLRTIESHESVKDVILFEATPGTYDEGTAPRLLVEGQVSIGGIERPPAATGIYVSGESDFDSDVRVKGQVGSYTEYGSTNLTYQTSFVGYGTTPIGGIVMWHGDPSVLPPGWVLCDGSGDFINDLGQQINIPDLRNRFVLGAGDSYFPGDTGGEEEVTLEASQMPVHSHEINDPGHTHGYEQKWHESTDSDNADDRDVASHNSFEYSDHDTSKEKANIDLEKEGGGEAHNNMPPYYVLAYIIRVQ